MNPEHLQQRGTAMASSFSYFLFLCIGLGAATIAALGMGFCDSVDDRARVVSDNKALVAEILKLETVLAGVQSEHDILVGWVSRDAMQPVRYDALEKTYFLLRKTLGIQDEAVEQILSGEAVE